MSALSLKNLSLHSIVRLYQEPGLTSAKLQQVFKKIQKEFPHVTDLKVELCYHVELGPNSGLNFNEKGVVKWLLQSPSNPDSLTEKSQLEETDTGILIEVGPRFNFSTSYSTNAVAICNNLGLTQVKRIELSRRYYIESNNFELLKVQEDLICFLLHDRMTECRYTKENLPKKSFNEKLVKTETLKTIDVLGFGEKALKEFDEELGLAFDDSDLKYYTNLFKNVLRRNPTNIEVFDLAQSNSEHSRHWFFKGKMIIDGVEQEETLIDMIIKTQETTNQNNVIKFSDNSSAIKGFKGTSLRPVCSGKLSELRPMKTNMHLIFTAETHNFPTGVAPFSGATTGTGGRLRDVQCVGRGGYCIAGTAGYSVGNLLIPDCDLPWENESFEYPNNFARPLEILVEASNGASDYGNKFGEPLIAGFVRSFGLIDSFGERKEWIKPIMFTGGIGSMEANMTEKLPPQYNDIVCKIGGPVYRIGVGGGSASSVEVQGDNKAELDFNAVQRGDAEMEQKLNRVVRACLEMGSENYILSIHDQGAGGNGNVLKELVEPVGAIIYADKFTLGDPTINLLELWGAEYQENNALLCHKDKLPLLKKICQRERCPIDDVGRVNNDGCVRVEDSTCSEKIAPYNLKLEHVLGKMPQKIYNLSRNASIPKPLLLPESLSIFASLERVLRLPSVSSKRYLTNKVDRCVTGLIAQQQCVGPLHTPLSDVAVTAISHFGYEGIASSIGEQPIKGLVNIAAGARMTVAESLSNLVFAKISDIKDVKCSGNWMWAAKLPGEGAALYDACRAMCDIMSQLGIAVDGGKDSLSMAARVGKDTVKAPGTLVISTYAPCPDVRKVVTPDLKAPASNKTGKLLFVDLSRGYNRLGGSALAQCYGQLGNESPDVSCAKDLSNAFIATQELIADGAVLSGHDVSDGGLIVTLLEMCFGGISGININITHRTGKAVPILFSEEVGWVLEVFEEDLAHCLTVFKKHSVSVYDIGQSVGYGINSKISIIIGNTCFESKVLPLMKMWEETSYRLELRQTIEACAESEYNSFDERLGPKYQLSFDPDLEIPAPKVQVKVAVVREEGTNGDREMAAALVSAGFEVWDVTMQDIIDDQVDMDSFRGLIFPGGFSYADVLGSAKGWAGSILFSERIRKLFTEFYNRPDTFSLGICNGCQLMAILGWVGTMVNNVNTKPDIIMEDNLSERFECRWSTVKIEKSNSIMLKGMENSTLGVWVAHGEGRFTFKNDKIYEGLVEKNCVTLRYVDDNNKPTEVYPLNPNGSIEGLAGVCSEDGRHLAMMPHPERCVQPFQCPYIPPQWINHQKSPWERMFKNAYVWCTKNNKS